MKKFSLYLKRFAALALCVILFWSAAGHIAPVESYTYKYVSLGDSIAGGYTLASPKTARYSTLVAEKLGAELSSQTVNGMSADAFLLALRSGAYDALLSEADFVTVNIGLNEIYLPLIDILGDFFKSTPTFTSDTCAQLIGTLTANKTLTAAADSFTKKMVTISSLIYGKAPGAVISFNNIYNPYTNFVITDGEGGTLLDLGALVEPYIAELNTAFITTSTYSVVDVYKLFRENSGCVLAKYDSAAPSKLSWDPHPTEAGHKLIAEAISAKIGVTVPSDIDGHWGEQYIKGLLKFGVFANMADNSFRPNAAMTRGEFVTVLGRLVGIATTRYGLYEVFIDVPKTEYYAPYITWAFWNEIVLGTGGGKFSPGEAITREEMAVILTRVISIFKLTASPSGTSDKTFADRAEFSEWSESAIAQISRLGIMVGDEGSNFNPSGSITRAEVATLLYRMNQTFSLHNIVR